VKVQGQEKIVRLNEVKDLLLRSLLKNSEMLRLVTGHDFSRADKTNQINGALAPAGRFSHQLHSI
jgi:hypothetical protein